MNRILLFCLAILFAQACASSGNSSSDTNNESQVSASDTTLSAAKPPSLVEVTPPKNEEITYPPIDADLLSSESKPHNITSYYKFYKEDTEEAERVLSGDEQFLKDRLDTLDVRNGYMRVMFDGDGESTSTEYVYWNLSDGRKLLGVNEVTYDFIGGVFTSFFEFRAFEKDRWVPFDVGDLAGLMGENRTLSGAELQATSLLDKVFPNDKIALASSFKLGLPQKGKDIVLTIKQPNVETEVDEPLRTVVLKFNDGNH